MSELPDLPQYKCHKVVRAAEIIYVGEDFLDLGVAAPTLRTTNKFIEPPGQKLSVHTVSVGKQWLENHRPIKGGYFVQYEDGYTSYSPAEAFEAGYSRYPDMDEVQKVVDSINDIVRNGEVVTGEGNAPTVSMEHINSIIVSEHYFTADEGAYGAYKRNGDVHVGSRPTHGSESLALLTFCVLVLKNGFTVTGESYCFDVNKFDAELGRKYAREKAVDKVFELEAYLLKERLFNS